MSLVLMDFLDQESMKQLVKDIKWAYIYRNEFCVLFITTLQYCRWKIAKYPI